MVDTGGKRRHQAEEGILSGLVRLWDSRNSLWVPIDQAEHGSGSGCSKNLDVLGVSWTEYLDVSRWWWGFHFGGLKISS